MKKIIFALLSITAFVACSNDETTDIQRSAIEFNPTTKGSVRTVATTTTSLSEFYVWSYTNASASQEAKAVMENMRVSNETGDWAYSPVKYWPYDAVLDFYAITPTTLENVTFGVKHHVDVAVAAGSAKINFVGAATLDLRGDAFECQSYPDIIYATSLDLHKADNTGANKVALNFRHAMSQIEFILKNNSSEASEVSYNVLTILVDGLDNKGTYTLPMDASTTSDFAVADSHGTWVSELTNEYPHRFHVATDKVAPQSSMSLTNKDDATNMHMVIPQTTTATFKVHMGIYQGEHFIAQAVKNVDVNVDWKEGYKYTYTLLVDQALDPDLEDDVIDFTITVDEIEIAPNQDVDLTPAP